MHDVRNLGPSGVWIMFLKVNPVLRGLTMGNVERCDKPLPLNRDLLLRRDPRFARAGRRPRGLARDFGLSREEYEAVRDKDCSGSTTSACTSTTSRIILRLFTALPPTRQPSALEAYRKAYPEEAEQASRLQQELEKRAR